MAKEKMSLPNPWRVLAHLGLVMIFLGALNYLLGWKNETFPAVSTIGLVFVAVGMMKSKQVGKVPASRRRK
jgi:hypothetical protein